MLWTAGSAPSVIVRSKLDETLLMKVLCKLSANNLLLLPSGLIYFKNTSSECGVPDAN